jgi:Ca2+-binding RTX toxin-like protein
MTTTLSVVATAPARADGETCDGKAATLVVSAPPSNGHVLGTEGNDVIVVPIGGRLFIDGLGGDDTICGGPGTIAINGGDGNDDLWDTYDGPLGSGLAGLDGGAGDDQLHGDAAPEDLQGGPGDDTLAGGGGDDTLAGDREDNTPFSKPSYRDHDVVEGGPGDDILIDDWGSDTLAGGRGSDQLLLGRLTDDVNETGCGLAGYQAAPTLSVADRTVTGFGRDTFTGMESYAGGTQESTLIGSSGPDDLRSGTCGLAHLEGRGGADRLLGNAEFGGRLDGGDGADHIDVDAPFDVHGGRGPDHIFLGAFGQGQKVRPHSLHGGPGSDWMVDLIQSTDVDLRRGVRLGRLVLRIHGIENAHLFLYPSRFSTIRQGTLTGTSGPNVLIGPQRGPGGSRTFHEILRGLGGNDRLVAGRHDTAYGGPGRDACRAQTRVACETTL